MKRRGTRKFSQLFEFPFLGKRILNPELSRRAFTLIELLIVIAIISIGSAFILFSVKNGQSRARDSQRMADLAELDSAINMYYRETGHYPDLPNGCGTNGTNGVSSDLVSRWASGDCLAEKDGVVRENYFIKDLVPKYISKLPVDSGPPAIQLGKQIRGYVYFHFDHAYGSDLPIECYKIMAFNPENPDLSQYKSDWDPMRQGVNGDWAWSKYSRGCEGR